MTDHFLSLRDDIQSLKEIQQALTERFPESILKTQENGYLYIPAEQVKLRMIQVLGIDAFDVEYSSIIHHEEDWITCTCTITVDFTKWGGRIKKISQANGLKIARYSNKPELAGQIVDLGNTYKALKSGAFSKAAQELGIGLYLLIEKKTTSQHSSNGYKNNGQASDGQKKAIYAMEKKISLEKNAKNRLLDNLFGKESSQVAASPSFKQARRYLDVLQPVCDLIDLIQATPNSEGARSFVFRELSTRYQKNIQSYRGLLTLATKETVEDIRLLLQNAA